MHRITITIIDSPLLAEAVAFMAATIVFRVVRWILDILP